jgi:integrase
MDAAASLLMAEGIPLPAVALRLGHSSPAITAAIYSHALKGSDSQVAQALDTALGLGHRPGIEGTM